MFFGLYFLFRGSSKFIHLQLENFHLEINILKEIWARGYPQALQLSASILFSMVLLRIVNYFGTVATASFGIITGLFLMLNIAIVGLSSATSTLVGQYMGAGRYEDAKKTVSRCNFYGLIIAGAVALLFWLFAPGITGLFNHDERVRVLAADLLRVACFGYCGIMSYGITLNAFIGIGNTKTPAKFSAFVMLAIGIPVAFALVYFFKVKITTLWILLIAINNVNALASWLLFKRALRNEVIAREISAAVVPEDDAPTESVSSPAEESDETKSPMREFYENGFDLLAAGPSDDEPIEATGIPLTTRRGFLNMLLVVVGSTSVIPVAGEGIPASFELIKENYSLVSLFTSSVLGLQRVCSEVMEGVSAKKINRRFKFSDDDRCGFTKAAGYLSDWRKACASEEGKGPLAQTLQRLAKGIFDRFAGFVDNYARSSGKDEHVLGLLRCMLEQPDNYWLADSMFRIAVETGVPAEIIDPAEEMAVIAKEMGGAITWNDRSCYGFIADFWRRCAAHRVRTDLAERLRHRSDLFGVNFPSDFEKLLEPPLGVVGSEGNEIVRYSLVDPDFYKVRSAVEDVENNYCRRAWKILIDRLTERLKACGIDCSAYLPNIWQWYENGEEAPQATIGRIVRNVFQKRYAQSQRYGVPEHIRGRVKELLDGISPEALLDGGDCEELFKRLEVEAYPHDEPVQWHAERSLPSLEITQALAWGLIFEFQPLGILSRQICGMAKEADLYVTAVIWKGRLVRLEIYPDCTEDMKHIIFGLRRQGWPFGAEDEFRKYFICIKKGADEIGVYAALKEDMRWNERWQALTQDDTIIYLFAGTDDNSRSETMCSSPAAEAPDEPVAAVDGGISFAAIALLPLFGLAAGHWGWFGLLAGFVLLAKCVSADVAASSPVAARTELLKYAPEAFWGSLLRPQNTNLRYRFRNILRNWRGATIKISLKGFKTSRSGSLVIISLALLAIAVSKIMLSEASRQALILIAGLTMAALLLRVMSKFLISFKSSLRCGLISTLARLSSISGQKAGMIFASLIVSYIVLSMPPVNNALTNTLRSITTMFFIVFFLYFIANSVDFFIGDASFFYAAAHSLDSVVELLRPCFSLQFTDEAYFIRNGQSFHKAFDLARADINSYTFHFNFPLYIIESILLQYRCQVLKTAASSPAEATSKSAPGADFGLAAFSPAGVVGTRFIVPKYGAGLSLSVYSRLVTGLDPAILQDILIESERAYVVICPEQPSEVYRFSVCEPLSRQLNKGLEGIGYNIEVLIFHGGPDDISPHCFNILNIAGIYWVIDCNWQQFKPYGTSTDHSRKVLIAQAFTEGLGLDEINFKRLLLEVWGIDSYLSSIWASAVRSFYLNKTSGGSPKLTCEVTAGESASSPARVSDSISVGTAQCAVPTMYGTECSGAINGARLVNGLDKSSSYKRVVESNVVASSSVELIVCQPLRLTLFVSSPDGFQGQSPPQVNSAGTVPTIGAVSPTGIWGQFRGPR